MSRDPNDGEPEVTIELFVRCAAPDGAEAQQNAVLDRLAELERRGTIDGYDVRIWGKQVNAAAASAGDCGRFAAQRTAEFREWAARNGVSIDSFFQRRHLSSLITDEETEVIVFPLICLAIYEDGDLRSVAPCVDDGRPFSVNDHLDVLEAGNGRLLRTPGA